MSKSPILVLDLRERRRVQSESDEITQVDFGVRHRAQAMCETPAPVTRARALYAVLWEGADAREMGRYL